MQHTCILSFFEALQISEKIIVENKALYLLLDFFFQHFCIMLLMSVLCNRVTFFKKKILFELDWKLPFFIISPVACDSVTRYT